MKIKNEKALVRFENYIYENLDADRKMIIPKIWNKYINSKNYYDYRENEICVNENAFYWDLLCKIRELQNNDDRDLKDSVIYCALPRYSTAWRNEETGSIDKGSFIRMLILLPLLKELNVNIIYLLPVNEYSKVNIKGDIGSPVAIKDFYNLDENLHDNLVNGIREFSLKDEFNVFVQAAHLIGMKVIMDFIPRVTARDSSILLEHPDWFYWIKKSEEIDFAPPIIPNIDFFQECTIENIEEVYKADSTKEFLKKFVLPPNQMNKDLWLTIREMVISGEGDALELIEDKMEITPPPAHSDWINDTQPIWTDITFWKLYMDNNFMVKEWIDEDQPPYILFDTIKANKFPCNVPNIGLWDMLVDVIRYYTTEYDLDGFRFDIGHTLPVELLSRLFGAVKEIKPNAIFISEDLFTRNHKSAAKAGYNIMLGSSWNEVAKLNKKEYATFINELSEIEIFAYACAETHDTPRIVTRPGGENLSRGLALINAFLPRGINFILSGYEVNEVKPMNCGLADNTGKQEIEKAFFNNIYIDWARTSGRNMIDYMAKVNAIRLKYGEMVSSSTFEMLRAPDDIIAFSYFNRKLLIIFNVSSTDCINVNLEEVTSNKKYKILINSSSNVYGEEIINKVIDITPSSALLLVNEGED